VQGANGANPDPRHYLDAPADSVPQAGPIAKIFDRFLDHFDGHTGAGVNLVPSQFGGHARKCDGPLR
jgi:hypothetical protein